MALRQWNVEKWVTGLAETAVLAGLVLAVTGVQSTALVLWLALLTEAAAAPTVAALGLGVLGCGLFVEHFLTDLAVNDGSRSLPLVEMTAITVTETLLWVGWFVVADGIGGFLGPLAAGTGLAVLLIPQHTFEANVLRGNGLLSEVVELGTVPLGLVEATGATMWLVLVREGHVLDPLLATVGIASVDATAVGVGVLAVALLVEHALAVRFYRRD